MKDSKRKSCVNTYASSFRKNPGALRQVAEKRLEYPDRKYYYKVVLPVAQLQIGLFVEIIVFDRDPEFPTVLIVNAHEQRQ